jgi:arginine decarboxylase-like protein
MSVCHATHLLVRPSIHQVSNIRMVKEAMREASYLYAELLQMGAGMAYLDVGGGLAVGYDAPTRSCLAAQLSCWKMSLLFTAP